MKEVKKLNRRSVITVCLLLSALFIMPATVVCAVPTRLDVTFTAGFIDVDPTHIDTVYAGGRVVVFYWEGEGGIVAGDVEGDIGDWYEIARSFYSEPYDPEYIGTNRLYTNVHDVFTVPTTLNEKIGSLTIEVRYRIDHTENTRRGVWKIIDSTGALEGSLGSGTYDGVFTGNIILR